MKDLAKVLKEAGGLLLVVNSLSTKTQCFLFGVVYLYYLSEFTSLLATFTA